MTALHGGVFNKTLQNSAGITSEWWSEVIISTSLEGASCAGEYTLFLYEKLDYPHGLKIFLDFPIFWPKKFLSSFLFLVKIRNSRLKSFLYFKQLFLRRVHVSYKVVSYIKKKFRATHKLMQITHFISSSIFVLSLELLSNFPKWGSKLLWSSAKYFQNRGSRLLNFWPF